MTMKGKKQNVASSFNSDKINKNRKKRIEKCPYHFSRKRKKILITKKKRRKIKNKRPLFPKENLPHVLARPALHWDLLRLA